MVKKEICKKCGRFLGKKEHKCPDKPPFYNRHHTEETKKKMSLMQKGKIGYFLGKHHTKESIEKMSIHAKTRIGEKSPKWNGGKFKQNGYVYTYSPTHPNKDRHGYIFEHRLIMEKHIGRVLLPLEVVHHINGIKDDNRIENLMLFSNNPEHTKYHWRNKT